MMVSHEVAQTVARAVADRREWGDLRNDALAKRYYDTAVACVVDALELSAADLLCLLLEKARDR